MHFEVPLLFVAASELSPTNITREGLFSCVGPDMCGQMVTTAKRACADWTLERLLACVDSHVPSQLITAREAPITVLCWACIGPLVRWDFAGTIWVLSWLHRVEFEPCVATCGSDSIAPT